MDMTRHQYYYRPQPGKQGRKPSTTTLLLKDDELIEVDNQKVIDQIRQIQADPDLCSGYKRMTASLMLLGFYISRKKVYRLMKENALLGKQNRRPARTYAKFRIVTPEGPLQVLEMDIKHIWIESERRSAYILSVIDTFTRYVLHWQVGFTMRSQQVQRAWDAIIEQHLEPQQMHGWKVHIEIRSDNGPQFCAKVVQEYFRENYLNQVFTHPYTPQENGHIESFHNILSNSLEGSYWSLQMLENRLEIFYYNYNMHRVHSACAYLPPMLFWQSWNVNLVSRILLKNRKVRFNLNVQTQLIPGILRLRETSCQNRAERTFENQCEGTNSTSAINLTPVNPLSSVTSCIAK